MKEFARGVGSALGIVAGFLPIAMSYGAVAIQAGISEPATVGMSIWLYAGASQFALVEGVRQQLSGLSILLTVLVMNLRHIPMSLASRQLYARFGRKQWLLYFGLVDETFAVESTWEPQSFSYYLGLHTSCWVAWVAGSWMGSQVGLLLPELWLRFALPGLFICLLMSSIRRQNSQPLTDEPHRRQVRRETLILIAFGIALTLMTQTLGSTGLLMAILGVAIAASLLQKRRLLQGEQ